MTACLMPMICAVKRCLILLGRGSDERFAGNFQAVRGLELPQLVLDLAPHEITLAGAELGHEVS